MYRFDPDRYYHTTDPALALIGTRDALSKQRQRGLGPRYHLIGKRVLYLGSDLNAFLDECAIEPADGAVGRTRDGLRRAARVRMGAASTVVT